VRDFRRAVLLVLVYSSLVAAVASGQDRSEVLVLDQAQESWSLADYVYVFIDESANLTIDEVSSSAERFVLWPDGEPNIGFTDAAVWLRFTIADSSVREQLLLEISYAPLDEAVLFAPANGGGWRSEVSGDIVPPAERPVEHRFLVYHLDRPKAGPADATVSPGDEATTYYLRVESESAVTVPLRVWREEAFYAADTPEKILLGVFFGLLFLVVIYVGLFLLSSREPVYGIYIFFAISILLFHLGYTGVGNLLVWPGWAWLAQRAVVVFGSLNVAFGIAFAIFFLQLRRWAPVLFGILLAVQSVAIVNVVLALFAEYATAIQVTNYLLIIVAALEVVAALRVLSRGFLPARYYLGGWIFLFAAAIIVAFKNLGALPSTPFTSNVLQIGTALQVVFLSLALGDKISLFQRERERAELELIRQQEAALKATEARLYRDSLTGLPNRNRLVRDLSETGVRSLFVINVDHFKELNDLYGNRLGDQVLRRLGDRAREASRRHGGQAYRLHADEFAVLLERELPESELTDIGGELYERSHRDPYQVEGRPVTIDVSIGISGGSEKVLARADLALSQAREKRVAYRVYDETMETEKAYQQNLRWIDVIRECLSGEQVRPLYQPIFNNQSGQVEKHEALMRLHPPDREPISPAFFLDVATRARLYPELSRAIIEQSISACSESGASVSVNLSLDDLADEQTIALIRASTDDPRIRERLVFEILESEGIRNYEQVRDFATEMKEKGISLAIDDFGSGYSNFEHILRLPVDYIKIDASLIKNIDTDHICRYIVETILDLTSRLGFKTVAEHVHSKEVFETVRAMGIDYSQGFYIGHPDVLGG
jgi:diguanylate cyclase (GGDEF)-like protein